MEEPFLVRNHKTVVGVLAAFLLTVGAVAAADDPFDEPGPVDFEFDEPDFEDPFFEDPDFEIEPFEPPQFEPPEIEPFQPPTAPTFEFPEPPQPEF